MVGFPLDEVKTSAISTSFSDIEYHEHHFLSSFIELQVSESTRSSTFKKPGTDVRAQKSSSADNRRIQKLLEHPLKPSAQDTKFQKERYYEERSSNHYAVVGGGGFLGCYIVYRLPQTRKVKKVYVFDLALRNSAWLYEEWKKLSSIPQGYLSKDYGQSYIYNVEASWLFQGWRDVAPPSVNQHRSIAIFFGWDRYSKDHFWDLNEEQATPAQRHFSHYGETKYLVEKLVHRMKEKGMMTVSIHAGLYDYGDSLVFSQLKGATSINTVLLNLDYVQNTAEAPIAAAYALRSNPEKVAGLGFLQPMFGDTSKATCKGLQIWCGLANFRSLLLAGNLN
ncbi:hypothetical protein BJ742DRAFT_744290 [Cladochytrium replicatum]|nr:hypothetical protein BJ742DRAFT_744290 [Cladochytrium replicatum]